MVKSNSRESPQPPPRQIDSWKAGPAIASPAAALRVLPTSPAGPPSIREGVALAAVQAFVKGSIREGAPNTDTRSGPVGLRSVPLESALKISSCGTAVWRKGKVALILSFTTIRRPVAKSVVKSRHGRGPPMAESLPASIGLCNASESLQVLGAGEQEPD
jgi:hypothetical protein